MVGVNPRTLTRRLAAFATLTHESRGTRFLKRQDGSNHTGPINLSDIIGLPRWVMENQAIATDIAAVAALLHFRPVLDHILSGTRLRAVGEAVGEDCFDLACDAPRPPQALLIDATAELPRPDLLIEQGWAILHRALPLSMALQFPGAQGDDNMRALAELAAGLVLERGPSQMAST